MSWRPPPLCSWGRQPGFAVVHVRGFPYPLREANLNELMRPKDLDLFR